MIRTTLHAFAFILIFLSFSLLLGNIFPPPSQGNGSDAGLRLKHTIKGDIRPKSIVHSGNGLFFAQNMMYRHTITVYNRQFKQIKTISDKVNLSNYDLEGGGYSGYANGSPVEVAFSPDSKYAWVSNYRMFGDQFGNPGTDNCPTGKNYDNSFIYKINTTSLSIESIIEVGSVPKYVAASPDGKYVLVTNWCSADLSIIDTETEKEIHRVPLDRYPRGIAIDSKSRYAYVSIMGEERIAIVKLSDFSVSWIPNVGKTPRHLCIDPSERFLYVTLSREGMVAKIDLIKNKVIAKTSTGKAARSMAMTPDGQFLYVVSYMDNTLAKVKTDNMQLVQTVKTNDKPIGVTFDEKEKNVWVACYTGSVMIFEDKAYFDLRSENIDLMVAGPLPPADKTTEQYSLHYLDPFHSKSEENPYYYIYEQENGNGQESGEEFATIQRGKTRALPSASEGNSRNASQPRQTSSRQKISELAKLENISGGQITYHIIVGSYDSRANALKKVNELKKKGLKPLVLESEGKYRISCSQSLSKSAAEESMQNLSRDYKLEGWILKQ